MPSLRRAYTGVAITANGNNKDSMKKQIRQILEEAAITCEDFEETTDKILALFGVVEQSEQLVCDECNFVELQGEIYQCTKCYKVEDRLAN